MSDIDDRLVYPDPVELGNYQVRQFARVHRHADPAMGVTDYGSLGFRPLRNWQVPGWPVLDTVRTRIELVTQAGQDEMTSVAGGETRDLKIVADHALLIRFGFLRHPAGVVRCLQLGL